jgi:hypothetical protein
MRTPPVNVTEIGDVLMGDINQICILMEEWDRDEPSSGYETERQIPINAISYITLYRKSKVVKPHNIRDFFRMS